MEAIFRAADLLYQLEAFDAAAQRLARIAKVAPDENDKVAALGRLAEIECERRPTESARRTLNCARERAAVAGAALSDRARAELLVAEAAYAFALGRSQALQQAHEQLEQIALEGGADPRLWELAGRAALRTSVLRYLGRDISGAVELCNRSVAAFAHAQTTRQIDQTRLLTHRAVVDAHDPERVRFVSAENAHAYAIAIEHGMIGSACDALYNALVFMLYRHDLIDTGAAGGFADKVSEAASSLALANDDPMLAAAAAAAQRRYAQAISLFERARREYHKGTFDWSPVLTTLQARVFFKARRFTEAECVARAAVDEWARVGLHGEGAALRIRAEALEALGRRRAALEIVEYAIEALQPNAPVHTLLATYRCAQRLRPRRRYAETIAHLSATIQRRDSDTPAPRLTPRELEVAHLVADGHTNPAIASKLGISRKTVANHVATIFECLGLRARWQLTSAMLDRR